MFRDLEIRILNLFRISRFELRISKGKLDHFVNIVNRIGGSLTNGSMARSLDGSISRVLPMGLALFEEGANTFFAVFAGHHAPQG